MVDKEPINRINRAANIRIAHGCRVNGIYRDHGIPRPSKEKKSSVENPIFNMKGEIIFRGKITL